MGVHDLDKYPEIKRLLEIPEDEPIFILRAKDDAAVETLHDYQDEYELSGGSNNEFIENIDNVIIEFESWRSKNRDKCGVPD